MTEKLEGWIEADGTEYVPNDKGGFDVIYPTKKKSKAKKSKAKKE